MSKPLVILENISAGYNGNKILDNISLTLEEGDFIGVIGPNGGGKTTLLRIILELLKPMSGRVKKNIEASKIGYLPQVNQFDGQFPITVYDVVLSGMSEGLGIRRKRRSAYRAKVDETLSKMGMSHLKDRAIGELSGGELQRTMLGRAIISSPRLLLLDEPNTYVDNLFEQELYRLLKELNQDMTILLVSHDVGTISPYIKSIACVNRSLHYHPSNEITTELLKVYNCPIELVTHGPVPHRVIHDHTDEENGNR